MYNWAHAKVCGTGGSRRIVNMLLVFEILIKMFKSIEMFVLLNVSFFSAQSCYRLVLNVFSGNTMSYRMAVLALLYADKKILSHRWASSIVVLSSIVLQMWKLLYVKASCQAVTHTLMLTELEASSLQEDFVPWHKERCDFQSAHIHLTHPDSCPWSCMMSSAGSPFPSKTLYLHIIRNERGAMNASLSHSNTRGVERKVNRLVTLMIILHSRHSISCRGERKHTLFSHKKVPWEDTSDMFTVMCWDSDVMASDTALPHDWTIEKVAARSSHDSTAVSSLLVCWAPPAGLDRRWCQTVAFCFGVVGLCGTSSLEGVVAERHTSVLVAGSLSNLNHFPEMVFVLSRCSLWNSDLWVATSSFVFSPLFLDVSQVGRQ